MIIVPPDIIDYQTSTDMVVREGTNVTLRCAATGSPAPTINWRREDGRQISLNKTEQGKRLCLQVDHLNVNIVSERERENRGHG